MGCLQYRVKVEKKNEELWKYLKKDIFKKTRDAIFDNGINEIPNVKESRAAYKAFGKDPSRYCVSSEALTAGSDRERDYMKLIPLWMSIT